MLGFDFLPASTSRRIHGSIQIIVIERHEPISWSLSRQPDTEKIHFATSKDKKTREGIKLIPTGQSEMIVSVAV